MLKKLFNFYIFLKFIYFFTSIKYGDISTSSLNISWVISSENTGSFTDDSHRL